MYNKCKLYLYQYDYLGGGGLKLLRFTLLLYNVTVVICDNGKLVHALHTNLFLILHICIPSYKLVYASSNANVLQIIFNLTIMQAPHIT